MKRFAAFLILILSSSYLFGQIDRMNLASIGRTYSVENQGRTVDPLIQQAEREFQTFDFQEGFFILETAIAQDPNSTEAYLLRAKIKRVLGFLSSAEDDIRMANRINPYAASLYGFNGSAGMLEVMHVAPEKALEELTTYQKMYYYYQVLDKKLIAEEENAFDLSDAEEILVSIENNNLESALEQTDAMLQIYPSSALAYDLKGTILQKQGKYEAASDAFLNAVTLEPGLAITWYNLGQLERSNGNFQKAKVYLDRAIALQEDLTKAYFERALLYKQIGQVENAINDYNTIIKRNGDKYDEAFLNRGLTKKMIGDYTGALSDLNRAVEAYPDQAEVRKNRGNLHLMYGEHEEAVYDYSKAIELDNDYAEAYYNRGLAFFLMYDKISGCQDMNRSIDLGFEQAKEAIIYFCTD